MYEVNDILYAGTPTQIVKVVGVKPLSNFRLLLTFSTGEKKLYNMKPLLDLPVFKPLVDITVFEDVELDFDTVTWCNGDIDIAPETLYQNSEPILGNEIKEA